MSYQALELGDVTDPSAGPLPPLDEGPRPMAGDESLSAFAAAAFGAQELETLRNIRGGLEARVGQLVLILMNVIRYQHHSLADLRHLILEPLVRDRVAIAHRPIRDSQGVLDALQPVQGIVLWASVNENVEAKIQEQIRAGLQPLRLAAEDWDSGDRLWLLDLIASDREASTATMLNFKSIAGDRPVRLHPIVASTVDAKVLHELSIS